MGETEQSTLRSPIARQLLLAATQGVQIQVAWLTSFEYRLHDIGGQHGHAQDLGSPARFHFEGVRQVRCRGVGAIVDQALPLGLDGKENVQLDDDF